MRLAISFAAFSFLVVGICLASPFTPAVGHWAGQATAHFALLTAQQNGDSQELLERLERARIFFEKIGWPAHDLKRPLRILAFNSEKEFDSYRPMSSAFAFYQRTREGDFVLMRSLEPSHYSVVVHEYMHFIVEHSGLKLPIWLNEGLADLYSTMESREAQVRVGSPPPGREEILHRNDWMDWQELAAVDHGSPYYRQLNKMQLFYSQSWALVHVLALNPAYKDQLHGFLAAVSDQAQGADPWTATYHQTLSALGSETQKDFAENKLKPQLFDIDIRAGALQSAEMADPIKQTEFALASVLAANPNMHAEAKLRFEMLAASYPDDPRPAESLGVLLVAEGRQSEAEQAFETAVKNRSQDPEILFRLAHIKVGRGSNDEAIALLQRAVAENPEYYNALVELGFTAAKVDNYELAAATLAKINEPKPEHAFQISYTLAYSLAELNQFHKAISTAERSRTLALNAQDKQQAAELLAYIRQEAKEDGATK